MCCRLQHSKQRNCWGPLSLFLKIGTQTFQCVPSFKICVHNGPHTWVSKTLVQFEEEEVLTTAMACRLRGVHLRPCPRTPQLHSTAPHKLLSKANCCHWRSAAKVENKMAKELVALLLFAIKTTRTDLQCRFSCGWSFLVLFLCCYIYNRCFCSLISIELGE